MEYEVAMMRGACRRWELCLLLYVGRGGHCKSAGEKGKLRLERTNSNSRLQMKRKKCYYYTCGFATPDLSPAQANFPAPAVGDQDLRRSRVSLILR